MPWYFQAKIGGVEECTLCKEVLSKVRDMDRSPANQVTGNDITETHLIDIFNLVVNM